MNSLVLKQESVFAPATFEHAQRAAMALASSDLVPESYRGKEKIGSCLLALDIANRVGASPLMVMQNLHIIHGRPSWSSTYIISALNSCGRFSPLRFKVEGTGDGMTCIASALDKSTGEVLEGPPVSIGMAKAEKWYERTGSKWKTMPDLMLRYRAAAFFGRLYAPDVLMGMQTVEEIRDVIDVVPEPASPPAALSVVEQVNQAAKAKKAKAEPQVVEPAAEPPPAVTGVEMI